MGSDYSLDSLGHGLRQGDVVYEKLLWHLLPKTVFFNVDSNLSIGKSDYQAVSRGHWGSPSSNAGLNAQ